MGMPFSTLSSRSPQAAGSRFALGCLCVAVLGLAVALPTAASAQARSNRAYVANARSVDIAVVGDSLANDLGRGMEDLFRSRPNIKIVKQTHYATGLTRKDQFNWNDQLRAFIGKTDTDTIVVLIGGNDSQDIRVDGRSLERFSKPWLAEYERRVAQFMAILKRAKAKVYWVGLPLVRSDTMSNHFRTLNQIYRRQAVRHRITYVSIWKDFADAGGDYTSFGRSVGGVKRQLRKNDGMHFTEDGTLRLAARVASAIGVR
jgi:hypothetical protein